MYYYIKVMYQQWSEGQGVFEAMTRIDSFINMVHRNCGWSKEEIKNYLESQDWFKNFLDNK